VATASAVLGVGRYEASQRWANDDLPTTLDTSDDWIRSRTGISSRRIASDAETVVAMGAQAARAALVSANIRAAEVDLVLLATCTRDMAIPGGAAELASAVGVATAGAIDLNSGCAGFCYALALASDSVRGGTSRHVLVVGSERLSRWLDWSDRTTAVLFGDGAGAVVVGPSPTGRAGIFPAVWGADGQHAGWITASARDGHIRMNGAAVFRWATTEIPAIAIKACAAANITPERLAAVIAHQANLRIIESIAKRMNLPQSAIVCKDVIDSANTSAASVPMALARLHQSPGCPHGQPALLIAFGAGLTYAAQVIALP
jgi:3-oxoacyl-[acyl-carrier-protein] synthase-3